MRIKVLYDYPSFIPIYGGVPRYVCEIFKELHNEIEIDLAALYSDNIYIKEFLFYKQHYFLTKKNFKGKHKLEGIMNLIYSSYKITRNNYDIFHATYNNAYDFGFSNASYFNVVKKPFLVTIHDMIYENTYKDDPAYTKHIESKKKLIYNANHIIAVSENTKKEILKLYSINPEKITVIYHGASPIVKSNLKNEFGKYMLFVGRRSPYKNFPLFVESITPLLLENSQLKLICVSSPFTKEEEIFFKDLGIRKQIIAVSVSDEKLNSLYRNALVFVFPSLEEGFGIPILEAFANECPVCLSNSSCFPEIAGNAAIYFDPKNKLSIKNAVADVIKDKTLAIELKKRGLERLALFSWKKSAQQTLDVYKLLTNSEFNFSKPIS